MSNSSKSFLTLNYALLGFIILTVPSTLFSADYFVSPQGSDANPGTKESPWKSLEHVNRQNFKSGDKILLQGGKEFTGPLVLDHEDGTGLTVGSYDGIATIRARPNTHGVYVRNLGDIHVQNLKVVGHDYGLKPFSETSGSVGHGVYFLNSRTDPKTRAKIQNIKVSDVEVTGFTDLRKEARWEFDIPAGIGGAGIRFESTENGLGYRNVEITRNYSHHNKWAGIEVVSDYPSIKHERIFVRGNQVSYNSGIPDLRAHSGSGIVMSGVNFGVAEFNNSHHNGYWNDADKTGPAGLWGYNSVGLLFQFNHVHNNQTRSTIDGDAIDFDGGVRDSLMQLTLLITMQVQG